MLILRNIRYKISLGFYKSAEGQLEIFRNDLLYHMYCCAYKFLVKFLLIIVMLIESISAWYTALYKLR